MTEADRSKSAVSIQKDVDDHSYEKGKKGSYPKSVFFIISNEFCERFSFYGMRTILFIYLSSVLMYSESDTKLIYHGFSMACYFTPLLGAIIADSYLGKFKTIFYVSLVYALGSATLSVGSFSLGLSLQRALSLAALALIALGTGGIKPCVAAFGGDQFVKGQECYLQQYFSIFYMCINAGSTLSTAITPSLRSISCNGQDTCYPLAFGLPALLLIISVVVFLCGRPFYRCIPPGENLIVKIGDCIIRAIVNRCTAKNGPKEHWLNHADDKYDQNFIEEVRVVCRVLVLYIPVPIFWALSDQQGSSWTAQATQMRWSIFGVQLLPEHMQLLNPLFILILAPLFSYFVYPAFQKCGLLTKPLHKMVVGGFLAAASFFVCMLLQVAIQQRESNAMTLINSVSCPLQAEFSIDGKLQSSVLAADHGILKIRRPFPEEIDLKPQCTNLTPSKYKPDPSYKAAQEKFIYSIGDKLKIADVPSLRKGNAAEVRVFLPIGIQNVTLKDQAEKAFPMTSGNETLNLKQAQIPVTVGSSYTLNVDGMDCESQELEVGFGYMFIIHEDRNCSFEITRASPDLSLIWQAPQYILITAGEVMFSVTGLEFSYSQAPKSMKSVLQAAWLLCVAFGNLFVVIVAKFGLQKQSTEFMVFGLAMVADMIFFAVLAYFYRPVDFTNSSESESEMCDIQKKDSSSAMRS